MSQPVPAMNTTIDGKAVNDAPVKDLSHTWIASATIELTELLAKMADMRHSLRLKEREKIDVLEVYCSGCRKQYEDAVGTDCSAKIDNSHLFGGDRTERVKRKQPHIPFGVEVTPIPAPRINRMGIAGVLNGEA